MTTITPACTRPSTRRCTRTGWALLGLVASACATGKPAGSGAPVELDGTRWKLVTLGGTLDGRVIAFKKKGPDGYHGTLVEPGKRLRDAVGVAMGTQVFSLRKKGPAEFEGVYKAYDASGGFTEREVIVFVDGNNLSWNQENALWEKQ